MNMRRTASAIALVALLAACSGGSSAEFSQTPASSGIDSSADGFSFPNFGAANTSAEMTGEDLRAMFGDNVCTNGAETPCEPTTEAAAWAQMVNQSRQAGHCEGMVVQAIHRYTTKATPKTIDLKNEGDTTQGIIRAFATQFFPVVRKESDSWAKKSIAEILSALTESFTSSDISYSMGLYTDKGGHAVLPISIEYPTPTTAKVNIYDSNWPGKDRYVLFDLSAQTWEFSFSGQDPANDPNVWRGGKGDIDLTSMKSRTTGSAPFETGANTVTGNFLVIRSTQPTWTITAEDGTITPTRSTSPTSTVRPLRNASTSSLTEFVVYTDSVAVDVQLPDASSAYAVSANKVVSIITNGASQPVSISADSIIVPNTTQVSVASANLAATVLGGTATISLNEENIAVQPQGGNTPIVVNAKKPEQTITISGTSVRTSQGSAITNAAPNLPDDLLPPDTKAGLTAQSERRVPVNDNQSNQTTTTAVTTPSTTSSIASPTTTKAPASTTIPPSTTTTVTQQNIVALQFMGSIGPWRNGQQLSPYAFRLINSQDQWASTASGTCVLALLPEFDNGSLGGASLTGNTTASANGNGLCEFSGVTINGTPGTKYRIRASLNGTNASTIIGPATLTS